MITLLLGFYGISKEYLAYKLKTILNSSVKPLYVFRTITPYCIMVFYSSASTVIYSTVVLYQERPTWQTGCFCAVARVFVRSMHGCLWFTHKHHVDGVVLKND